MKVESIEECSPWSILQYFQPALSDNYLKTNFRYFYSGTFTQVLLCIEKQGPSTKIYCIVYLQGNRFGLLLYAPVNIMVI